MKNVLYNVRVKWDGVLDGTAVAAGMGGQGSQIREQQNQEADNTETETNGMVNEQDRAVRNGGNNPRSLPAPSREQGREEEGYTQDTDGLLCAWKDTVYARTFEDFETSWDLLCDQFAEQTGMETLIGYRALEPSPILT